MHLGTGDVHAVVHRTQGLFIISVPEARNIKMQTGRVLPETIRVRYATSKSQGMPEKKGF